MDDDAPAVIKLSQRRLLYPGRVGRARKRPQDYASVSEYLAAEVVPALQGPSLPKCANLGYPALKRNR